MPFAGSGDKTALLETQTSIGQSCPKVTKGTCKLLSLHLLASCVAEKTHLTEQVRF
jgi:hypothetical protein